MKKTPSILPLAVSAGALLIPHAAHAHHAESMAGQPFLQGLSMPAHGVDHILSALAVGLVASRTEGNTRINLLLLFPIVAVLGGFMNLGGLNLPEFVVPLTVLVSGLLLWKGTPSAWIGAILVATAGLVNGQALIENAPVTVSSALFAAGCLLGAGALTGLGFLLGRALQTRPSLIRFAGALLMTGAALVTLFPTINSVVIRLVE